jgi:hypothetical protein
MKTCRWIIVWLSIAFAPFTLLGTPLNPTVKKGQAVVSEKFLPLVCLTVALSPGAGKLGSVVFVRTDTKEKFTAEIGSVFSASPTVFTREEEPGRALSMIVVRLPEGRYQLKEAEVDTSSGDTYKFDLSEPAAYFFTVRARSVNYLGTLVLSAVWQHAFIPGGGRSPAYFVFEDTSDHDKAWVEKEVPGLARFQSAVSLVVKEKPRAETPEISFPVTARSKVVITFPIRFLSPPHSFIAEPGEFSAVLETVNGVYFAAPQGLQFGNAADPNWKEGGIFLPTAAAKFGPGGFYVGKPPEAEVVSGPWRNLFVQEGVLWHLEQPTLPAAELPANWKEIVTQWVATLEKGKWKLRDCGEPRYRYSEPSGWLVALTADRTGRIGSDEYSPISLLAVIVDGKVRSLMLTARFFHVDKSMASVPIKHPIWESAAK